METASRPWGSYQVLFESGYCKVKKISVKTGEVLSYKSHSLRNEDWVVVKGSGFVVLDDATISVDPGSHVNIPANTKHRIGSNSDCEELVFIEVQTGDYFGEDDIVRFQDEYGRI